MRGDDRYAKDVVLQPLLIAAIVALLGAALTVVLLVAHQRQSARDVELQAREVASTMGSSIERYVALLAARSEALAALVEIQPDIAAEDLERYAARLIGGDPSFRNLALAPGDVVSFVHPRAGNEGVVGVNLSERPGQRDVVLRVRGERRTILAGPMNLIQGGTGVASRSPVLIPDPASPEGVRYWGLAVLVIDYDAMIERAGLRSVRPRYEVALRGRDAAGPLGEVFHGPPELFDAPRATAHIDVPGGSWLLAARPREGWGVTLLTGPWLLLGFVVSALFALLGFRIASDRVAIRELAMSDPLTRLPNRRHVQWQLRETLDQLGDRIRCGALILIDFDDFKPINDTLGHRVGDEVLRVISARMRASSSSTDFLARIGGDEFLMLHTSVDDQCRHGVEAVATQLLAAIAQTVVVEEHAIGIRASMGIAMFPEHGRDPNVLRECADRALYAAKSDGGNRATVYVRGVHDFDRVSGNHRALPAE